MTQVKPLGKRLLLKRSEMQQSQGGILLPETAQEKPKKGKVLAIGEPEQGLNVGDEVYFSSYAGTEVTVDQEEGFLVLNYEDVLCVVEA